MKIRTRTSRNRSRGSDKESSFSVDVKTYTMNLRPHEIDKLAETLQDSLTSTYASL
jgi:hypothetical protein